MRTIALTLVCLLAACAFAQDESTVHARIFGDPALATGDLDAHAASLVRIVKDNQELAALRRWQIIEDQLSSVDDMYRALADLARDDFKRCGRDSDEFADAYVHLARRCSADLGWQAVKRRWAGVTQAAFIGPFCDPVAPAHDDVFSPEVMMDFSAEYDGAWGRVRWAPVKHDDDLDATLQLGDQQRWSGYGYYVASSIVSEDEQAAVIKLKFSGSGKVWLGGAYLLDADARSGEAPDEYELPVRLKRGRNLLMVKLSSIASLRIRLRDEAGRPLARVVTLTPKAGDKPQRVQSGTPALAAAVPHALQRLTALADATGEPAVLLSLANEFQERGLTIAAAVTFERAAESPEPLIRAECLHWLERSPLASYSEQRKRVLALADELLAANPGLVPAVFEKADLLAADERWRESVALLEGLLEKAPPWRVHLQLAGVYLDAGWAAERESAMRAACKAGPDSLPVLKAASDHYGSLGALAREVELDRKRLAILPGDPEVHLSLANTLGRMGDNDGAVRHLRALTTAEPANDFLLGRLAEALAANGHLAEALKTYDLLASRSPVPEQELYQAARACLQLGRQDQGVEYLQRALKADPGHHVSRRELQRIRGDSEDFWSAHALSWDEIMRHDVTAAQFPRASSAAILDESIQLLYADGSSVNYVHIVRKILSQEGVDERGKDRINGELVTARTVKADGTVLEPITQPGGLIEFSGVEVGAYLDVAYIVRGDGGPLETLNGDAFFFMDQNMAEPFAISRWVLIAPGNMPLQAVHHNLDAGSPGVTISEKPLGDHTVRAWDVRNPRHPEFEAFMPSPLEFAPWVQFVHPRDWRERGRKVAADGLRLAMDTPLIRAQAAKLTEGLVTDEARARAIYAWVNATFTTAGDAWNAHQALQAGAGDREQVFVSLCTAAGIKLGFAAADAAQPYKSPPEESLPRPHWGFPDKQDFESFFIVVRGEAGLVYVDMGQRLRPFGAISPRLFNAPAILWFDGAYSLAHLPGGDRDLEGFENKATIQLAEDGSATLEGSITIRGERSYEAKESMRTVSFDDLCVDLESDLAQQYPGFEVSECRFPRLGEVGEPLVQEYVGSIKRAATPGAGGLSLTLPGEKLGRLMSVLVGARKREFDIVLNFDLVQSDEIRIKAPQGYVFRELPKDLVYPTAPLVYELRFSLDEGDLVMKRRMVLGPGRFIKGEYNDLVEQIKRIRAAEDATLKLVKSE